MSADLVRQIKKDAHDGAQKYSLAGRARAGRAEYECQRQQHHDAVDQRQRQFLPQGQRMPVGILSTLPQPGDVSCKIAQREAVRRQLQDADLIAADGCGYGQLLQLPAPDTLIGDHPLGYREQLPASLLSDVGTAGVQVSLQTPAFAQLQHLYVGGFRPAEGLSDVHEIVASPNPEPLFGEHHPFAVPGLRAQDARVLIKRRSDEFGQQQRQDHHHDAGAQDRSANPAHRHPTGLHGQKLVVVGQHP